jgi:hypothetical protein
MFPGAGGAAGLTTAARSERTRHDARGTPARARRRHNSAAAVRAGTADHARGGSRCASKRQGETRRHARGGPVRAIGLRADRCPGRVGTGRVCSFSSSRSAAGLTDQLYPPSSATANALARTLATRTSTDARVLGAQHVTAKALAQGMMFRGDIMIGALTAVSSLALRPRYVRQHKQGRRS